MNLGSSFLCLHTTYRKFFLHLFREDPFMKIFLLYHVQSLFLSYYRYYKKLLYSNLFRILLRISWVCLSTENGWLSNILVTVSSLLYQWFYIEPKLVFFIRFFNVKLYSIFLLYYQAAFTILFKSTRFIQYYRKSNLQFLRLIL